LLVTIPDPSDGQSCFLQTLHRFVNNVLVADRVNSDSLQESQVKPTNDRGKDCFGTIVFD